MRLATGLALLIGLICGVAFDHSRMTVASATARQANLCAKADRL
jgi:hypothetical protein